MPSMDFRAMEEARKQPPLSEHELLNEAFSMNIVQKAMSVLEVDAVKSGEKIDLLKKSRKMSLASRMYKRLFNILTRLSSIFKTV